MRPLDKCRKTECYVDGEWIPVHWEQLDKGDLIRVISGKGADYPDVVTEQPALQVDPLSGVLAGCTPTAI